MIQFCEIIYDNKTFEFLENYLKDKNLNDICFIFFYDGKYDIFVIHNFIKNLEATFNIIINYFDISDLYKILEEKERILNLKFDVMDWNQTIIDTKNAYINAIRRKIENENNFS